MVSFELEPKSLLTIHTVLLDYLATVFMRALISDLQDLSIKSDAPPFLPHLHIQATIRRPSRLYRNQGRVVVSIPGSKKRAGKGVWGHPLED
jgi:hypothetical protein